MSDGEPKSGAFLTGFCLNEWVKDRAHPIARNSLTRITDFKCDDLAANAVSINSYLEINGSD